MTTPARTYALGLIGEGVGGSLTPALQETEARAQGIGLTYRLLDLHQMSLTADDLPEVLRWARRLGFDGFNVTHPCKQAIIPLLDQVADDAAAIQAVNTVVITDGVAVGHNTDASGFLRALDQHIPGARNDRVVLIGAGGAGCALAHALLAAGSQHVTLVDIDQARRKDLAGRLQDRFGPSRVDESASPDDPLRQATGLVHATPTGMKEHPGLPLSPELVRPDLWVADIVYFPLDTELTTLARARGCRVMRGGGMAVYQAVEAFEYFTGHAADAQRMLAHFDTLVDRPHPAVPGR